MGLSTTSYLIAGIVVTRKELRDKYHCDLKDEKWLPMIEGHPGAPFKILEADNMDEVFLGHVINAQDNEYTSSYKEVTVMSDSQFNDLEFELSKYLGKLADPIGYYAVNICR